VQKTSPFKWHQDNADILAHKEKLLEVYREVEIELHAFLTQPLFARTCLIITENTALEVFTLVEIKLWSYCYLVTNISEKCAASIYRVRLHDVETQKTTNNLKNI
jgi:hypothetical protein